MEKDTQRIERSFDAFYRMNRLNELRIECGLLPFNFDSALESSSNPSVGIEIEMTWDQAFFDMRHWRGVSVRPKDLDPQSLEYCNFSEQYSANDLALKPLLHQVSQVIPRVGIDAYWEFSFLPTKDISVLAGEVETLFDLGLLREDEEYATHLTIAGVKNDRDAFAVLVACELAGGTTLSRLSSPLIAEKGTWSRRPDVGGGLRQRAKHELYGTDSHGYELRTLVTTSARQITNVAKVAQSLARMMSQDPETWLMTRRAIEENLLQHDLPLRAWGNPKTQPDIWLKYMQLVDARS